MDSPVVKVTTTKPLIIPILLLLVLYVLSIFFFHNIEGWSYLDAAYYTTVTLATVGYGDYHPATELGKIGAIVLIFTGVSLAFYVITHIGFIREKTIDPHVQKRIEMLRNLTALQTGDVEKGQWRKIRTKINSEEKKREFGRL